MPKCFCNQKRDSFSFSEAWRGEGSNPLGLWEHCKHGYALALSPSVGYLKNGQFSNKQTTRLQQDMHRQHLIEDEGAPTGDNAPLEGRIRTWFICTTGEMQIKIRNSVFYHFSCPISNFRPLPLPPTFSNCNLPSRCCLCLLQYNFANFAKKLGKDHNKSTINA